MRLEKAGQHDVNVEINGTRSCEEHVASRNRVNRICGSILTIFDAARSPPLRDEINYPERKEQKILLARLPRNLLCYRLSFYNSERLLTVSLRTVSQSVNRSFSLERQLAEIPRCIRVSCRNSFPWFGKRAHCATNFDPKYFIDKMADGLIVQLQRSVLCPRLSAVNKKTLASLFYGPFRVIHSRVRDKFLSCFMLRFIVDEREIFNFE